MSNRIKEFRKEKHMTAEVFAKKVGVARTTMTRIELGGIVPSLYNGILISKALGKRVEEVFPTPDWEEDYED